MKQGGQTMNSTTDLDPKYIIWVRRVLGGTALIMVALVSLGISWYTHNAWLGLLVMFSMATVFWFGALVVAADVLLDAVEGAEAVVVRDQEAVSATWDAGYEAGYAQGLENGFKLSGIE